MTRNNTDAAFRAGSRKGFLPIVRALHQFGPAVRIPKSGLKLFLDDARNPPLHEEGWIVVRNVRDAIRFMIRYGHLVTEISFDNDLASPDEGHSFLRRVLLKLPHSFFPNLRYLTIHTGNLPRGRLMMQMARGCGLHVKRREPNDWIYPASNKDSRYVKAWRLEDDTSLEVEDLFSVR